MNGGIRWLALNGEAMNGRGNMRGAKTFERGTFWDLRGRENFGERGEIVWENCIFWFEAGGICWTVTGEHWLLGVLGSGARNPHGILELGSRIGSVPSWQGGKIQFWAESGQISLVKVWAEKRGQMELGK